MKSFYQNWLQNNKKENEEARASITPISLDTSTSLVPSTSRTNENSPSTTSVLPSFSRDVIPPQNSDLRNNIIYQNDKLQLFLEKGNHVHQIRFKLQDHLFYMKIKTIDSTTEPPLLRDILDFLNEGFTYILKEVRRFYNPEDHNVAYLTLYQEPMISGLNTGKKELFMQFKQIFNGNFEFLSRNLLKKDVQIFLKYV